MGSGDGAPTRILVATTSPADSDGRKEADYAAFVAGAGGEPVLVRRGATGLSEALEELEGCCGLLLAGGPDVEPSRYGAAPHRRTETEQGRDELEFPLLEAAARRGLPVLGICRGLQVINVWRGGSLLQHLPDVLGDDRHAGSRRHDVLLVRAPAGGVPSRLQAAIDDSDEGGRLVVTSSHHQAVDRLGDGLVVTAWSVEPDGKPPVVEALEAADRESPFLVGVQWHPERLARHPSSTTGTPGTLAEAVEGSGAVGFERADPAQYRLAVAFVAAARVLGRARAQAVPGRTSPAP
jgi:putative glutamine amidotransferase